VALALNAGSFTTPEFVTNSGTSATDMYYLAEVFRTTSKAHSFLPRLARAFPTRALQRAVSRKNSNNIRLPVSPTRSFKSRIESADPSAAMIYRSKRPSAHVSKTLAADGRRRERSFWTEAERGRRGGERGEGAEIAS